MTLIHPRPWKWQGALNQMRQTDRAPAVLTGLSIDLIVVIHIQKIIDSSMPSEKERGKVIRAQHTG